MSLRELLRWQWEGYPRYHRSRTNLAIHILAVPVFFLASLTLVAALTQLSWRVGASAVVAMVVSIAVQGAGHRREPVPPEPFRGALDAVARILCEQWVTFPRFVAAGGWRRAWHGAGND